MTDPMTRSQMLIDEKWMSTPDMGEYLDSGLIQKAAEELADGKLKGEFFIETPFATTPGYYPTENVIIISGKPSFQTNANEIGNTGLNTTDGDTVYLNFDEIIDGGQKHVFNTTEKPMTITELFKHISSYTQNSEMLGIRVMGIDAPELPHYRDVDFKINKKAYMTSYAELIAAKDPTSIVVLTNGDKKINVMKKHLSYAKYDLLTAVPTKRKPEEVISFVQQEETLNEFTGKTETVYFEVVKTLAISGDLNSGEKYRLVMGHGEADDAKLIRFSQALSAQKDLLGLINDADDVIYMIDQTYIANKAKGVIPYKYKKEYEKISESPFYAFKSLWTNVTKAGEAAYQQMGKRYFGQELNGRYLGAIYVKHTTAYGSQWINVAKYLTSKYPEIEMLPIFSQSGAMVAEYDGISDIFKMWTYDKSKQAYLDKINDIGVDDRAEIQKQITGLDLFQLTDHTVMVGDVLLMVPPTSIRTVTQTRSERISMIRAKGGLTKTLPKTERIIEMQVFFNGDDAINGIEYNQFTPSGTQQVYHMNGLRSLIAQFKFTPFLPIHNDYINHVLDIEAVSLNSIEIATVPDYPKTLQATIRMQEFDYRQYMPEILPPDPEAKEDLYTNIFSKVIHWPVFRYYYQKSIKAGEKISSLDFNSEPYIYATIGQQTALQEMEFKSPTFDLYVANEEHLKQRKMLKQSLERNPIESVITFNSQEEKFIKEMTTALQSIIGEISNKTTDIVSKFKIPTNEDPTEIVYNRDLLKEKIISSNDMLTASQQRSNMGVSYSKLIKDKNTNLNKYEVVKNRIETYAEVMGPLSNHMKSKVAELNIPPKYINSCDFVYKQYAKEASIITSVKNHEVTYQFGIEIDVNWLALGHTETLDKVKRLIAKDANLTIDEIFKDGKMFLGWTSEFNNNPEISNQTVALKLTRPPSIYKNNDYKSIGFLAASFGMALEDPDVEGSDDMWTGSEDLGDMKDNIDLETAKSAIYDLYDIGNPIVTSIQMSYNNVFNRMSLKIFDGYASQFTGGTDTAINIEMTATNEYTVNKLQAISKICTQRLIDYRKILASSPLRIDCEMTRMMGVNEVIIESVDISTVPNYPDTWNISMTLSSVDRTLRNREAMKKIDKIHNAETSMDSAVKVKNFFDIKNTLAKIELYPDLELPTISELEKLGFYFIKYKAESCRVFPDADFYFSYLHVFSSEMLRETIVNFFKDQNNMKLTKNYSGDLFEGDTGHINFELNRTRKAKLEESGKVEGVSDLDKVVSNDLGDAVIVDGKTQSKRDEISKSMSVGQSESELTALQVMRQDTNTLLNEVNEMNKQVLGLTESLDATNFSSYDFNTFYKISVKDKMPYNQAAIELNTTSVTSESRKINIYEGNGVYKEVTTNTWVKDYNDSLKRLILETLSKPIPTQHVYSPGVADQYKAIFEYLNMEILSSPVKNISFSWPDKNLSTTFDKQFLYLLEAAARGASADIGVMDIDKRFSTEKNSKETLPKSIIYQKAGSKKQELPNILVSTPGQGINGYTLAETDEERKSGDVFGKFGIKRYSPSMLSSIVNKPVVGKNGFLDPYYNKDLSYIMFGTTISEEIELERINEYTNGIIQNTKKTNLYYTPTTESNTSSGSVDSSDLYADHAFFRNMLMWFYKLLNDERSSLLTDSILLIGKIKEMSDKASDYDDGLWDNVVDWVKKGGAKRKVKKLNKKKEKGIFSSEQQQELDEKKDQSELREIEENLENELEQIIKDINKEIGKLRLTLSNGLFLSLATMALCEFDTPVYSALAQGNLGSYVSYIEKIKSTNISSQLVESPSDMQVRKMYQYLDYTFDTSKKYDDLNGNSVLDKYSFQGKTHRLYLKAAEDPSIYIMHSFYDMVMNDMRGRMARAFPTYYMLLIDEGRDLGLWKLQDNFYDVSSITEFQVVKSRKIAADTAKIVMTNLFGTFTTEDDDMKDEYNYTFKDMYNSVFSPKTYTNKEFQRHNEGRDVNRAKLRPGARISLRMGYSADASKLPIMFNGSLAEVQEGDLMTLVCQGDGIELSNPAMFNATDSHEIADLQYNDDLLSSFLGAFSSTTTPREILLNPLIAEGKWIHEKVKNWSRGRLFNANPFGIVHFGDKHFKEIFPNHGEVEQNIYEALSKPSWGADVDIASNDYSYSLPSAPTLKVGLEGNKSYWDLMHIAQSVAPDYVTAIVPFQMRSSVFYGAPRYYCAYDYDKLPNAQLVEKRKPFQQYHVYTSYTDIIANGITASDKEVRTCAVGIYQKPGVIVGSKSGNVGPLFLDIDIFPENQKMTTINCNFEYRNIDQLPFTIPIVDAAVNAISENGGYQTAWRATANGLKDTVKDMYTGELIVMGDPCVKPHDRIYINDLYEDMQGMFEVESVVHTFNLESGFTTSITPDCIAAIDNKYEQVASATIKDIIFPVLTTHATICASSILFQKTIRSMFFAAYQALDIGTDFAKVAVDSISKVMGKESAAMFSGFTDGAADKLGFAFGVTSADLAIYKAINKIDLNSQIFKSKRTYTNSSDLSSLFDDILNLDTNLKNLDPKELNELLASADDYSNMSKKDADLIKRAKENAALMSQEYREGVAKTLNSINIEQDDISKIVAEAKKKTASMTNSAELDEAFKILDEAKGIKYIDNVDDIALMNKQLTALKNVSKHVSDLTGDIATIATKIDTTILGTARTSLSSFDNVADTFSDMNKIRKSARSFKSLMALNALWLAADIIITKSFQEFIERKLKNWQVLTIFPVMKNGRVLTAGLNGNKGSVFGSPSYNQVGWLEQQAINFFDFKGETWLGGTAAFLRDVFITTDEMKRTIDNYKRDNGFGEVASGSSSDVSNQAGLNDLLAQVAKSNIKGFNAYRELYFDARVESSKSQEAKVAYRSYKLTDITEEELENSSIVASNLVPITNNNNIVTKLSNKNVFKFVGDASIAVDTGKSDISSEDFVMLPDVTGTDKKIKVHCKKIAGRNTDGSGNKLPVFVLPYLRPDAQIVFDMVINEICKVIQPDYKNEECKFEYLHKHNIVLHNGVMINETSWMNTGFGFILEVKNYPGFADIIKSIQDTEKSIVDASKSKFTLTHIEKDKQLGGNVYAFWISPKKTGDGGVV